MHRALPGDGPLARSGDFDESKHPRDEHGRWTESGGGEDEAPAAHELNANDNHRFHDAISAAKASSRFGASVHVYEPDQYRDMRMFLSSDGKAGFALKGDDIVSAFRHSESNIKDFAGLALRQAVKLGGRRLDAFDTVLPELYSKSGFRAVARLKWDESQKPPGWDKKTFERYNGGEPDVVFMVHDPGHGKIYQAGDGKRVATYAEAVAEQDRALAELERKDWDESKHPRVPAGSSTGGEFASDGGGEPSGDKHPGAGYSKHARLDKDGVIHTSDVHDAQRALFENRKVELKQPKQVSTLIHLLAETVHRYQQEGEQAPLFDLCNVSVAGTNLFCAETKGIPRVEMPQLNTKQTKAFVEYLKDKGYKVEKAREKASHLRATQNQLSAEKVVANLDRNKLEPERLEKRLVISRDNYILDGHHHWAAKIALDAADNKLNDDTKMRVSRVDIDIITLLKEAEKFTGGKGKKPAGEKYLQVPLHDAVAHLNGEQYRKLCATIHRFFELNPEHERDHGNILVTIRAPEETEDKFKHGVFVRAHVSHDTAEAIHDWAKTLKLPEGATLVDPDEYHTTLVYSHTPFDYQHDIEDSIYPTADASNKHLKVLGKDDDDKVLTLRFDSEALAKRFATLQEQGAVSDFPSYKPHITVVKNVAADHDVTQHDVYDGNIVFTSESAEPIDPDRKKDWDESKHPRQPGGSPEGGQFASSEGGGESGGAESIEASALRDTKEISEAVAQELGFPKTDINISHDIYPVQLGDRKFNAAGSANLKTGRITLYPQGMTGYGTSIGGVTAHEIEHIKFQTALDKHQAEYRLAEAEPGPPPNPASEHWWEQRGGKDAVFRPDGTLWPPYDAKYPNYQAMEKAFRMHTWEDFAKADGVSDYSYEYWKNWKDQKTFQGQPIRYEQAVHETLAEIGRLKYTTGLFPEHMGERIISWRGEEKPTKAQILKNRALWRELYRTVEKVYKGTA